MEYSREQMYAIRREMSDLPFLVPDGCEVLSDTQNDWWSVNRPTLSVILGNTAEGYFLSFYRTQGMWKALHSVKFNPPTLIEQLDSMARICMEAAKLNDRRIFGKLPDRIVEQKVEEPVHNQEIAKENGKEPVGRTMSINHGGATVEIPLGTFPGWFVPSTSADYDSPADVISSTEAPGEVVTTDKEGTVFIPYAGGMAKAPAHVARRIAEQRRMSREGSDSLSPPCSQANQENIPEYAEAGEDLFRKASRELIE